MHQCQLRMQPLRLFRLGTGGGGKTVLANTGRFVLVEAKRQRTKAIKRRGQE